MKRVFLVLFLGFSFLNISAQIIERDSNNGIYQTDSTSFDKEYKIELNGETKYTDFKIISYNNDTTLVDTTLTLKKDTKFNYLRKDNFELLAFHNQGQTFNKLAIDFENNSLFPVIGASAKQHNYYKVEDIKYYYVPTPTTELMYRTGLEQGQMLDAFLTMNTSKQLNFSLAYKGLRSLGKYRNTLASHGNFRATFNYTSLNKRYYLRGHFSSFDLYNEENGGLTATSVTNFESGDSNYTDRGRLDVNFTDATNMLEGKRYYFDHSYSLISKKRKTQQYNDSISKYLKDYNKLLTKITVLKRDSLTTEISAKIDSLTFLATTKKVDSSQFITYKKNQQFDITLGHSLMYETKHYRFNQGSSNSILGSAFNSPIEDHTSYQKFNNQIYGKINTAYIGELKAKINYFNYNYHYNSILFLNNDFTISDKMKGNAIVFGAEWNSKIGKLHLNADASQVLTGDITGTSFKASATFKKDSIYSFKGFTEITSKTPEFNKLLYQSGYVNYNWKNNFSNEEIKNIGVEFKTAKWGNLKATYSVIDNYTYFNETSAPTQTNKTLNYLKIKASKALNFGKFTLDNTIMYQKVSNGESFFRVPELVTRNSLYYSSHLFKGKPLYLQTGVTLKYFTKFKANAYNPLLSEFVLQNDTEIGNFPMLDFFANAQIRRTRIYFKIENFGASLTGRDYYSAPNYPYRDLTVRFGVVWNFFI